MVRKSCFLLLFTSIWGFRFGFWNAAGNGKPPPWSPSSTRAPIKAKPWKPTTTMKQAIETINQQNKTATKTAIKAPTQANDHAYKTTIKKTHPSHNHQKPAVIYNNKKQTAAAVDHALERITWCSPIFLPKASRTWAYGKETSTHACIRLMVW